MKAILDLQTELNRRCSWSNERLALSPSRDPERASFAFPFVRLAPPKPTPASFPWAPNDSSSGARSENAAAGSTKVRGDLWSAQLVVAFLKHVSAAYPELLLELRDEGGFVIPGAVWFRAGKVELQREFLNRERERVLEITNDPQSAAPFVWAESEALQGRFFQDVGAADYIEIPELQELDLRFDELQSMTLGDAAEAVVRRITSQVVPVVVASR